MHDEQRSGQLLVINTRHACLFGHFYMMKPNCVKLVMFAYNLHSQPAVYTN